MMLERLWFPIRAGLPPADSLRRQGWSQARAASGSQKPDTTRGMAQASTGRRDFLKASGAAALTSYIFTGNLAGANDQVNIGFIG